MPFEPPLKKYSYGKGLGMVEFFYVNYAQMAFIEENLLYYKKVDGTTYGKPFYISVDEDPLPDQKPSFYPNPASQALYFELLSVAGGN